MGDFLKGLFFGAPEAAEEDEDSRGVPEAAEEDEESSGGDETEDDLDDEDVNGEGGAEGSLLPRDLSSAGHGTRIVHPPDSDDSDDDEVASPHCCPPFSFLCVRSLQYF